MSSMNYSPSQLFTHTVYMYRNTNDLCVYSITLIVLLECNCYKKAIEVKTSTNHFAHRK